MTTRIRVTLASLLLSTSPALAQVGLPEVKGDAAKVAGENAKSAPTQGGGTVERVKQTAKDTGKGGVDQGAAKASSKAKPVVGEKTAASIEGQGKGAGHTGVDKGVDAAADKAAGALGGTAR